jgi:hypothetical protein
LKNKLYLLISSLILFYGCSASIDQTETTDLNYPDDLNIISREEWGWQPGVKTLSEHSINKITLHHGGEFFPEDKNVIEYLKNTAVLEQK